MNFSSLVLMERDKENNQFVKELGSYQVNDGAEYITKMYYDGEKVHLFFDTRKDVEDWEYTAIFDLFNDSAFIESGYDIENEDNEYNPTWHITFDYIEEVNVMEEKLQRICTLIKEQMEKVFKEIQGKQEEYK
ncbi:DUF6762 family protein [Clostridium lundense]|uniref:DUF6762 family protein n=1 Tax=Clostridium lundense TaxID=319475 RepID=UPI0004812ED7|nr:DUF6762 family protein [Clostridium lundense]